MRLNDKIEIKNIYKLIKYKYKLTKWLREQKFKFHKKQRKMFHKVR